MPTIDSMKRSHAVLGVCKLAEPAKPSLMWALRKMNRSLRRISAASHHAQHLVEWGVPPLPENYDHHLDLHWAWAATGNSLFVERGVYANLAIEPGAEVLDICYGDGFCAKYFYSHRAKKVLGVDFDPEVIAGARRVNAAPNIGFRVTDIRDGLPEGKLDPTHVQRRR